MKFLKIMNRGENKNYGSLHSYGVSRLHTGHITLGNLSRTYRLEVTSEDCDTLIDILKHIKATIAKNAE